MRWVSPSSPCLQPPGRRLRGIALLAGIGAAAYLWISPILTPDLVRTIRTNSLLSGGYRYTPLVVRTALLVLAGAIALWYLTRRWVNWFDRFAVLFAYVFVAVLALAHFAKIAILPQPERYHLEMEMALCLALSSAPATCWRGCRPGCVPSPLALFVAFLAWQARLVSRLRGRPDPLHRYHPDHPIQDGQMDRRQSQRAAHHGLGRRGHVVQRLHR